MFSKRLLDSSNSLWTGCDCFLCTVSLHYYHLLCNYYGLNCALPLAVLGVYCPEELPVDSEESVNSEWPFSLLAC